MLKIVPINQKIVSKNIKVFILVVIYDYIRRNANNNSISSTSVPASSAIYSYDANGQSNLMTPVTAASTCPTQSSYMSTSNRYDEISLKTPNMYYQPNHDQTHLPVQNNNSSYYSSWSSNSAYDSATPANYSSSNSWNYSTSGCYPDLTSSSTTTTNPSLNNNHLTNSQHLNDQNSHLNHHLNNHANLPVWSSGYGTNQVYYQ